VSVDVNTQFRSKSQVRLYGLQLFMWLKAGLLVRSQNASGFSCSQPTGLIQSLVFLGLGESAETLPNCTWNRSCGIKNIGIRPNWFQQMSKLCQYAQILYTVAYSTSLFPFLLYTQPTNCHFTSHSYFLSVSLSCRIMRPTSVTLTCLNTHSAQFRSLYPPVSMFIKTALSPPPITLSLSLSHLLSNTEYTSCQSVCPVVYTF
jgi:hypothetical protein